MKWDIEKIEPVSNKVNKLRIIDDKLKDNQIKPLDIKKCDNVSTLFNDSWVKVEQNKLFKISIDSEPCDDNFQTVTGLQKVFIYLYYLLFLL